MTEGQVEELEEPSEEKSLIVVDPENYQRTKKLQQIHETKKEVLKVRQSRAELIPELSDRFIDDGLSVYQRHLARTVAQYGSELYPLIEESLERGILAEEDLTIEYTETDLLSFIESDGHVRYDGEIEHCQEPHTMAFYRQLEKIQRKLGLGLEIEESKGPAEI